MEFAVSQNLRYTGLFRWRRQSVAQFTLGETTQKYALQEKNTWPKHKLTVWKVVIRWFLGSRLFFLLLPYPLSQAPHYGTFCQQVLVWVFLERFRHVVGLPLPKLRHDWSHPHQHKRILFRPLPLRSTTDSLQTNMLHTCIISSWFVD